MTLELVTAMLGWCTLINIGLLMWWFLFAVMAHDWTFRVHTKWFNISPQQEKTEINQRTPAEHGHNHVYVHSISPFLLFVVRSVDVMNNLRLFQRNQAAAASLLEQLI